jgi:hypothetical protein
MRANEEDSSVAVNVATVQDFGFMLEKNLDYQQSWFDKGKPCEGKKNETKINPICYSHKGPGSKKSKLIITGKYFEFEAVDSSSLDLVKSLAHRQAPVTASILGHPHTWSNSRSTGELVLTSDYKAECKKKLKNCSSHAVLIVGYDLNKRVFTFKNSWGEDWGAKGYGTISFDYIDQMSERKFITGQLKANIF